MQYGDGAVPVVDLRKRFELDAPIRDETRLMVLELEDQRVGVLVDEVREVHAGGQHDDHRARPRWSAGWPPPTSPGIITRPGRTIIILNARKLLSSTERLALSEIGSS